MSDHAVTEHQKIFLDLLERSLDIGDGWRSVSDALWPHTLAQAHPKLTELEHKNKRVRLTEEGQIFMRYAPNWSGYK